MCGGKKVNEKKVSVIIPFFSNINWLTLALDSVNSQLFKDFEVIVIDDGSKHDLSGLYERYSFDMKIIKIENSGPSNARNIGISLSRGKYIAFLDSDDIWDQKKLKVQVELMEKNSAVWSQHSYTMIYENGKKNKKINTKKYSGDVFLKSFISLKIQTSTIMVLREELIKNNIKFPVNLRYGEDGEFYRELAIKHRLFFVDEYLSLFRIRENNAGFDPNIQLEDKKNTWERIKGNKKITKILPDSIIWAYKFSGYFYKISRKIDSKKINNKTYKGVMYLLYLPPYLIFKYNSWGIERKFK
nr:glycosyltransferase family 2 protein [Exiguobacterium sp. 17-1]